MKYRFILTYKPTEGDTTATRTCFPLHGDDLSISIDRAEGEWYYTRNLDGKLVFERDDYEWIMGQEFDGTFTLDIKESHDNGATFYDYFTGTFSRASLEIDQDNHQATLNGLKEGVEDLIKNGKSEDYDLMKLIPDSYAKEVQGQVPPALALVDECSEVSKPTKSDIFCNAALTAGGYNSETDLFWGEDKNMAARSTANLCAIIAEAKVQSGIYKGMYAGEVAYSTGQKQWIDNVGREYTVYITSVGGILNNSDNTKILRFGLYHDNDTNNRHAYIRFYLDNILEETKQIRDMYMDNPYYSPITYAIDDGFIQIQLHYIYASLLTQAIPVVNFSPRKNYLDTSNYYKGIRPFNNNDDSLVVFPSVRTVDQPNGHRLVPGTGEQGEAPQYFAPPNDSGDWIPLAEDNWNYASMWYTITPSVANGLLDPAKFGSFTWTRCWTIGTCIQFLLQRATDGKVVFAETTAYSQFLYGNPNPVEGHEPFQWLVTQKSNVMRPSTGGAGASRCIVRLDWFLELLRNAFNCYYWFEKRNDGRYDFRIEHVEYFRRGGTYTPNTQDNPPLDLTRLKPYRNFLRNGQPAKRYADQTNRYTFDLDGMVEKYTYSWQGDGGGDDFRGNPMYFKAGWIEKGSSEDHQVDNIFADLGWLMLNAGTDTESSKNYDGLFIFGGYQPFNTTQWKENEPATQQYITVDNTDAWLTIPQGQYVNLERYDTDSGTAVSVATYPGTGTPTHIPVGSTGSRTIIFRLNLTANYANVVILRLHARSGNVFRVPNVDNLLRDDDSKLQNGALAWPWLQVEYLHYDIPAAKWTYKKDEYTDNPDLVWESDGTIKMVKKQNLAVVPVPDASTEDAIVDIMGVKTGLGTGIIDNAKINLSSRNAEMTIIYDINSNNN